ncbi:MAG TPA: MgtC/SapB family protein [Thermoanaerobaculia bacterium]|nr:MgtC/SapB family protein [Thermoanaerobaculia bacterium]
MIPLEVVVLRLSIALLFGAIVGVEREWRQKHAGVKTLALVAIGAAGFAMMSDTFGPTNHNPAQIAAAVVGGIGFIGAGVIMHRGLTVQGVTTAATLWADASVGLASGLGQFAVAGVLTLAIVIVQFMVRRVENVLVRVRRPVDITGRFEVRVECASDVLPSINESWTRYAAAEKLDVIRHSIQRGPESVTMRAVVRVEKADAVNMLPLEESLVSMAGVRRVEVRHLGVEDE